MSRALDDLSSQMRPKAFELIARAAELGVPVMIVDTIRTEAEQKENVAKGVSWTLNSRHLPRRLRGMPPSFQTVDDGKADAIDVCPYDQFQLHGPDKLKWDEKDPAWQTLGRIGMKIGLKWGVLKAGNVRVDLGHFELFPDEMF
jgi:peptidoglycan L-alanyl-D-glutamate endopeptidase CwlK